MFLIPQYFQTTTASVTAIIIILIANISAYCSNLHVRPKSSPNYAQLAHILQYKPAAFRRPYWVVRSRLWYNVLSVCRLSVCNVLYCG